MISLHDWMRERLLNKKGLGAPKPPPKHRLEDLAKSEWSAQFETYMRNRLIMGALRYGLMKDKNKPKYDRIKSIEKRLLES